MANPVVHISSMIPMNLKERKLLEEVFGEMILELQRGDKKHGRHAGPKRAMGALKAEVQELATEMEAENVIPGQRMREATQVMAMGFKTIRDCIPEEDQHYAEKK